MSKQTTTAFDLTFTSWPPHSPPVRHGVAAPIGAIRIARKDKFQTRMIKVRLDGPPQRRWMKLARFWWLKNIGPVPPGMRVCHADGDSLNDAPSNYELMTAADVICLAHLNNPTWSEQQHRRASRGTAQSNRDRSMIERARSILPSRWYGVDFERRIIHNDPQRHQWQVYAAHGMTAARSANGRGYASAVLGWPGMLQIDAVALACLAEQPCETPKLWTALRALCDRQRWTPPRRYGSLIQALSRLRRKGLIRTERRGRQPALHSITDEAMARRQAPCPIIAVRGDELEQAAFAGFTREMPGFRKPRQGGRLNAPLAQAG